MSGRVRVDQPDGRQTTGYRKTQRRNLRRPLDERLHAFNDRYRRRYPTHWKPDVRLGFLLPPHMRAFISEGSHGIGVYVHRAGFVQITNGSAAECFISVAEFFDTVAKDHPPFEVLAVISSSSHPGRKWTRKLNVVNGAVFETPGHVEAHVWMA